MASLILILFSCIEKEDTKIRFVDIPLQEQEMIELFLSVDDKNYSIEKLSGMGVRNLNNDSYSEFDIPNDAICAIENYWAGTKTFYYVKKLDDGVSLSVRKGTRLEGSRMPVEFEEILKVNTGDKFTESEILEGTYSFVETDVEGEDLILVFENNEGIIRVFDAPTKIWAMYQWESKSQELKGRKFRLRYDKTNDYLIECEKVESSSNKSDDFYIINVMAVPSEEKAQIEVDKLKSQGYRSDYLWIPDFQSLSKAKFFAVYIGPFREQYECEMFVEEYRKTQPNAYGLLVSQKNKRVQINGINKVTITEPYHK